MKQQIAPGADSFQPPDGLMANEQVLWVNPSSWAYTGKRTSIVLFLFGSLFVLVSLTMLNAPGLPACRVGFNQTACGSPAAVLGIGLLFIKGGMFALYKTLTQKSTRYYLTTFRLVRTKGGRIVRQVLRTMYRGKNLAQFLIVVPMNMRPNGIETYGIRILDPESGDPVITLANINSESAKLFESIGNVVYCKYDGRNNDASTGVCSNCGANLQSILITPTLAA